ncbi:aminodeoxychorismate/anthranilate synthase component II [Candidatus Persebacteraceae bacterium Df01]|jgi:anthranilate synthase/aminodeoxychorismate synthase-like glutamine amidotransferase|uniref:Aminodeoxychorismate/anthranilate synthase component II n=1 Tax=Candidatus Doriopsillibacter californiensis TaxID=2970740 RepID=A0ABT7QKT4_9GAMM|nr:aminodeoxychorismate/anthranilate synthase component II [Candidatus Persebacteraceae bacterium Df01]
MLLLIDNYDSFTYNLYQYLLELQADVRVCRNDVLSVGEALAMNPEAVIISPGPGFPIDAGISLDLIHQAPPNLPILGVCLGHQALGEAFGGKVSAAKKLMHGKTSDITHDGKRLFAGVPSPLTVMRYHSLVLEAENIPDVFEVTAVNPDDGEVMAIRHRTRPLEGLQFHPESIMTDKGKEILDNFLCFYVRNKHEN